MRLETPKSDNVLIEKARNVIQNCVHCGFCNATCPTYQLTGDELDGPRGRIYLIKSLLEGKSDGVETQFHLDRCLTCRNCETTCPSGVSYGELVNIGRHIVDERIPRPTFDKVRRKALVKGLSAPQPLGLLVRAARLLSPILPAKIRTRLPQKLNITAVNKPTSKRYVTLDGCAQRHLAPQINTAMEFVMEYLGIAITRQPQINCCGALHLHTTGETDGIVAARTAIDGFIAALDEGASGIIISASGCGVHIKDYPKLFAEGDPYHAKAIRVANATADVLEVVMNELEDKPLRVRTDSGEKRIAVHEPCTLQHGQRLHGALPTMLSNLGMNVITFEEPHLCCGSAGSYSILQSQLSTALRERKLKHIETSKPDLIVSANIGCILHLNDRTPVRHWIEVLAEYIDSDH